MRCQLPSFLSKVVEESTQFYVAWNLFSVGVGTSDPVASLCPLCITGASRSEVGTLPRDDGTPTVCSSAQQQQMLTQILGVVDHSRFSHRIPLMRS